MKIPFMGHLYEAEELADIFKRLPERAKAHWAKRAIDEMPAFHRRFAFALFGTHGVTMLEKGLEMDAATLNASREAHAF